jgi:DNA-binding winged helix-turn-helix (wHTH) protein/TolB-like protein
MPGTAWRAPLAISSGRVKAISITAMSISPTLSTFTQARDGMTMGNSSEQKIYQFGDFRLDASHLMLYRGNNEIPLAPKAVQTLLALVERSGEIVRKEELIERIWPDSFVDESNLFLYLSVLRKTLGKQNNGEPFLETLRRRGYRFIGQAHIVREITSDNGDAGVDDNLEMVERTVPDANAEGIAKTNRLRHVFWLSLGALLLTAAFAASSYWRSGPSTEANADAPRAIAILPFKPLVADNRDQYLELGMADALITRLGERREIVVRPLSSVRAVGGVDRDAVAAGRALGVDVVLDSEIQKTGDQILVKARLIRVTDGSWLWTDSFRGTYGDILELQKEISHRILTAVKLRHARDENAALPKRYTESVEAWEYYLKGSYQVGRVTPSDIQKSIENISRRR